MQQVYTVAVEVSYGTFESYARNMRGVGSKEFRK